MSEEDLAFPCRRCGRILLAPADKVGALRSCPACETITVTPGIVRQSHATEAQKARIGSTHALSGIGLCVVVLLLLYTVCCSLVLLVPPLQSFAEKLPNTLFIVPLGGAVALLAAATAAFFPVPRELLGGRPDGTIMWLVYYGISVVLSAAAAVRLMEGSSQRCIAGLFLIPFVLWLVELLQVTLRFRLHAGALLARPSRLPGKRHPEEPTDKRCEVSKCRDT